MVGSVAFIGSVLLLYAAILTQSSTNLPIVWLLVIGSAVWAAWDSTQIHLRDYKSGVSHGPVGIALGILLIWIVAFPVYLATRYGITHGTLSRRESASPVAIAAPSRAQSLTTTSAELERLADLRTRGVLTEEEFTAAKGRVLSLPQARP